MILPSAKSFNLLPTAALTSLINSMTLDKAAKTIELQTKEAKIAKLEGKSSLRAPVQGRIQVSNRGTPSADKQQQSLAAPAKSTANGAALLNDPETNPTGEPAYVPGTVPPDTSSDDIADMASEVNEYYSDEEPPSSSITLGKIATQALAAAGLLVAIASLGAAIDSATNIIEKRARGELPNPSLNFSAIDLEELPPSSQEKITAAMDTQQELVQTQIIAPFVENQRL